MKKRIFNKIIIMTLIFLQLLPYEVAFAVSLSQAQQTIASFAVNFYNKSGTEVSWYNASDNWAYRDEAYLYNTKHDNPTYPAYKNKLCMDCVGWVNYCIHNATGLDCGIEGNIGAAMCFCAPGSSRWLEEKRKIGYFTITTR